MPRRVSIAIRFGMSLMKAAEKERDIGWEPAERKMGEGNFRAITGFFFCPRYPSCCSNQLDREYLPTLPIYVLYLTHSFGDGKSYLQI